MTADGDRLSIGTVGTTLSIAVELTDVYTGGRPVGPTRVSLVDRDETFRRSPTGDYVLCDLPNDVESVRIRVDGAVYLPEERSVELSTLDELSPVVSVALRPAPNYAFGTGVTLVRGHVVDADDEPVPGATVTIDGRDDETRSDHRGEFVVWFDDLARDEVGTNVDGERFVEIGGTDPQVRVENSDGATATERLEVPLGAAVSTVVTF